MSDQTIKASTFNPPEKSVFSQTTSGITVSVSPTFISDRSDPAANIYAYSYRVELENNSEVAAQLINRHWEVFSAEEKIADVKGEGVLGEKPMLEPGDKYDYESWTVVRDPLGAMSGSYTFLSENGDFFEVAIPRFSLIQIDEITLH